MSQPINSLLLNIGVGRVLVPHATVAEITSYSAPAGVEGAPAWHLGWLSWRGRQIPLISFEIMEGLDASEAKPSRQDINVVILKTLNGDARMPFFALMMQGMPRTLVIREGDLQAVSEGAVISPFVSYTVTVQGDTTAVIPDFNAVERELKDVQRVLMH